MLPLNQWLGLARWGFLLLLLLFLVVLVWRLRREGDGGS